MTFEELEKITETNFHINYKIPQKILDISFFEVDFKENDPDIIDMMVYKCDELSYFCVFNEFCYQIVKKNMISDSQISKKWRFFWN